MEPIKQKVVKGVLWAWLEKFSLQIVGFGVTLVLARLLTPDDYGTVSLLGIFIAIAGTLADVGFGSALIQKKNASDLDFNSVFYFSLVMSSLAYCVLFMVAPWVARFYGIAQLCPILRVISFGLILNAVNSIQNAELNRKLKFNLSFRISLVASVISAAIGILLALKGWGAWALVWQTISSRVVRVVLSWMLIKWRPKLMFSMDSLTGLFSFGWKFAISALVDSAYSNLYGLLIGKYYSKADLAFVDKGRAFPGTVMSAINSALERVMFPVLSQLQDNPNEVKRVMRRMIKNSTFLVFPLMMGVAVCADSLVRILFGEQWISSIPYMRLVCLQCALYPFHTVNLRAILALGKSDVFLKLEIIKKVFGVTLLALSLPHGVYCFMLVLALISSPISVVINSWPNRRLLQYTIGDQVRDVLPSLVPSFVMGGVCLGAGSVLHRFWSDGDSGLNMLQMCVTVLIQLVLGGGIYTGISYIMKIDSLNDYISVLRPLVSRRRHSA